MRVFLSIFFVLLPGILLAQIVTEATSNKSEYVYGELMEVTLKITNTSDEPFDYRGPSTGLSYVESFSGIDTSPRGWTLDEQRDTLWEGQSIEVIWQIIPAFTSFPTFTGEQTVEMQIWGVTDSVKFNAQQYIGGMIDVYFDRDIVDSTEAVQYADSLNIKIIEECKGYSPRHPRYCWETDTMLVDTLIANLLLDEKIISAEIENRFQIESINYIRTSTEGFGLEPSEFSLSQNYPNPFNPETTIEFTLEEASFVELSVYDLMGRKVIEFVSKRYSQGEYSVLFDARNLSSGTYIYKLTTEKGTISKKLTLIK